MFPKRKNEVKIIVAVVDNSLYFSLNLFIEIDNTTHKPIGHIYDLLINNNCYEKLKEPDEILTKMIAALEMIAWVNYCTSVKVLQRFFELSKLPVCGSSVVKRLIIIGS